MTADLDLDAALSLAVLLEARRTWLSKVYGGDVRWVVNVADPDAICFVDLEQNLLELHELLPDGRLRRVL